MDPATGGMQTYLTAQDAMKDMTPKSRIVPIKDEDEVAEYDSGRKRVPPFNVSGLR